jgi:hypothetical protein
MKYFVKILAISLLFGILSCTEKDNPINNNNDDKNYLKCTVDGTKWQSTGTEFGLSAGTHYQQIKILGFNTKDSIEIILKFEPTEQIVVGEYELAKNGLKLGIFHSNGKLDTASSGKVYITYLENEFPLKISGTFNMNITTSENKNVTITDGIYTSGNFEIKLF